MSNGSNGTATSTDVVVVGAGMAGIYLLHKLRTLGFSAIGVEAADGVGGTWYWNRYPGARCDVQSLDYSYSFDPDLEDEWQWTERYSTQPEILSYLNFVADKHGVKEDIRFETRVDKATWDEDANRWRIITDAGDEIVCQHYVMATGCLSTPKTPDVPGVERYQGDRYFTSRWPHEGVDFTGKRVAVIGTGSSAIQSIPLIAAEATELTVYQRTANFSMPAKNGPIEPERRAEVAADPAAYREAARWSRAGVPLPVAEEGALQVDDDERQSRYEAGWESGSLFGIFGSFADILVNQAANDTAAEFIREKIRATVDDPETAESLCPDNHPFGTKRPCLDTNYYSTYNQPHVKLVDLRKTPITTVTETGIETAEGLVEIDALVFATGFDAMTGAIVAVDVTGRDGARLDEHWRDGPQTYLGLTAVGFPNYFMITGPQSPSVLSNMVVSIEQHVDWICDAMVHMRDHGFETMEPTQTAEAGWVQHSADCGAITLYSKANSWYMGANVPGKPRIFLPYVGGVDAYRQACNEVIEQGYLGFAFAGDDGQQCNDGVIRRVQPDVTMMLDMMGRAGSAAHRVAAARGGQSVHVADERRAPAGARRRRDRRRCARRRRRRPALPPLPPADGGSAPDHRLLPRRRMGAGRSRLRRSPVP